MQSLPTRPKRLPVAGLTPAATRLLVALLTLGPGETYDDAVERSGIHSVLTFLTARKQLVQIGFIIQRDGREYTTLYQQEPVTEEPIPTIPYPSTVTRITKAKQ